MKRLLSIVSLFAALSAFAFDATSYIQDGLIANWDGITHDPVVKDENNVSYWKDLVGGYAFKLTNNVAAVGKGFSFTGDSNHKTWGELSEADQTTLFGSRKDYTLEVVVSFPQKQSTAYVFRSTSGTGIGFGPRDNNNPQANTTTWFALTSYNYWSQPLTLEHTEYVNKTNSFTVTYTNKYFKGVSMNGVARDVDETAQSTALPSMYYSTSIGAAVGGSYQSTMQIFAIRIYERPLTAEEIAYNASVDDERFRGIKATTREIAGTFDGQPANLGVPVPDYGLIAAVPGESVSYSIAGSMQDYDDGARAFACGDGMRAFYRDATVAVDGVAETVTDESFVRTIAVGENVITWNFTNEQVLVAVATEGGGSISGKVGWVPVADETVTLTAVPADGTRFFAWEGLPDGVGDPYAATLTLPLDRSYALKAKFVTQLYPGETYPDGYAFITANWTDPKSKVPAGADSSSNDLEARFRTVGEFGAGDFDPNQLPGFLLLVR